MKKPSLLFLLSCAFVFSVQPQSASVQKVSEYSRLHEADIMNEFISFLSIPNVASDSVNIRRNADFIMNMMKKRGIGNVQLLNADNPSAPPAVYGEVKVPGAISTIVLYAHYDGQPVNPLQWAKGLDPFIPKLFSGRIDKDAKEIAIPPDAYQPDYRIYARGASDDKAGVAAILNAYEAITKTGMLPASNIKFFFEGEEEAGSTHLAEILENHKSLLQSDLWIICDGPVHQSGKKQVIFGVRGDTHIEVTVFAAKRPLHSGHYGNWSPNPGMQLAKLIASMKDDNGKVTIKGFYDDVTPLSVTEKKALQEIPSVEEQMKTELGIAKREMHDRNLYEALMMPSLNVNGMQSANTGKLAANIIPTTATASLDLRLVSGNDWKRQQQKVIDHIKAQGFYVTDKEPTDEERKKYAKIAMVKRSDGYNAQRTSMDLPLAKKVIDAVKATTGEQVVLQPSTGGSLPLYVFEKYLNAKTISVPIANHDNNQHAENENIRIQNFRNGIETMAALMMMVK